MAADWIHRVHVDPLVCSGKAVVRGTRVPVHQVLDYLAAGDSEQAILEALPALTFDDIRACLHYAAHLAEEESGIAS